MKNKYYYGVVPLLLFIIFALSVMFCLMTGAKTYGRVSKRDDTAFTMRTASQYISVRIRQTEAQKEVRVEDFKGVCSVVLPSRYEDEKFITRLYCYDGNLYELFCPDGADMLPKDGEKILVLSSLDAEKNGYMLTVRLTDKNGEISVLDFFLRGEGGTYEE